MTEYETLQDRGFVRGGTAMEVFYQFIRRGEEHSFLTLPTDLEAYLVNMLLVSAKSSNTPRRLALILLDAEMAISVDVRAAMLHELGFEALKLAGFFPKEIQRRHVTLDYVKNMARTGYGSLGGIDPGRVATSGLLQAFIPLGSQIAVHIDSMIQVLWYARDDMESVLEYTQPVGVS